jgi:hypothetical protein
MANIQIHSPSKGDLAIGNDGPQIEEKGGALGLKRSTKIRFQIIETGGSK